MGIRKPDYFLNVKNKKLSKLIANIIYKTDELFEKIKPDALLVYGDTNTSLGILSAKEEKYLYFIWKLEIDVLIKECLKK